MATYKLEQVSSGYAEVWFPEFNQLGVVQVKSIVASTDFEQDEIHMVNRWFAYVHNGYKFSNDNTNRLYMKVGRKTGYEKRAEALQALSDYIDQGKHSS